MKNLSLKATRIFFTFLITLVGLSANLAFAENQPSMMDLIKESNYQVIETDKPKSAVLIDANTGKLLWSENPDNPHNPASIMKLMVIYLTYEAMEQGKFTMETTVKATPRHQEIANIYEISNNKIVEGVDYPVKELIPMALVPSSNIATMMLAELVEPDAVTFLKKMNDKATEFGMTQTKIVNATGAEISAFRGLYGIDNPNNEGLDVQGSNVSTARDFAIFTYHLLNDFPQILEYTSTPTVTAMKGTPQEETFTTYNYSVPGAEPDERDPSVNYHYEGVDGLKTGSSPSGAFNIDMTAKKNDLRLIAIVFGVGDWADQTGEFKRHPFANAMLNYGFSHFEYKELYPAGETTIQDEKVILKEALSDVVKTGDTPELVLNEDESVSTKNELPQVSDKIMPIKVPIEIEEVKKKPLISSLSNQDDNFLEELKESVDLAHPLTKWIVIIMAVLVLLMLLLTIILIRDRRKRKRMRENRRERL